MESVFFIILILFLFLLAGYYDRSFIIKGPFDVSVSMHNREQKNKRKYLLMICVIFYLLVAFRDVSVGMDTKTYCEEFLQITRLEFRLKDQGYTILTYLISRIFHNSRFFLMVTSVFFPVCFYFYLKDEPGSCLYVFFSVLILMTIGLFAFAFSGIRQTIALSFILLAYKQLKQQNFWKYLFWIFVAFMFHYSAVIFLIAYPLKNIKSLVLPVILFVTAFILGAFYPDTIIRLIGETVFSDIYGNYGTEYQSSNTYSMLIIQLGLMLIPLFYYKKLVKTPENRRILNTAFMMLYFQALTPVIAEFFRIAYYFSVALCLLLPRVLATIPDTKSRNLTFYGLTTAMILYLVIFGNILIDYKFFFLN